MDAESGGCRALGSLSIPGTHDSCALYGGAQTETQTMSLSKQLAAGIRFLDIRPRLVGNQTGNTLPIYHGDGLTGVSQNIDFTQVASLCVQFLQSNPKECILMLVKQEGDPENPQDGATFDSAVAAVVNSHSSFFYTGTSLPLLGQVRGKIVLLRRYAAASGDTSPLGIDVTQWQDDATFQMTTTAVTSTTPLTTTAATIYVQDEYQDTGGTKWDDVYDLLQQAQGDTNSNNFYLNYLSYSYLLTGAIPGEQRAST